MYRNRLRRAAALLPTGQTMNPASPQDAMFFDAEATMIVVRKMNMAIGEVDDKASALRVFTTFGGVDDEWTIGTRHYIQHDQTMRDLGQFKVVGIALPDGTTSGEVPSRKIKHWVFK